MTESLNMLQLQTSSDSATTTQNPNELPSDDMLTQGSEFAKQLQEVSVNLTSSDQSSRSDEDDTSAQQLSMETAQPMAAAAPADAIEQALGATLASAEKHNMSRGGENLPVSGQVMPLVGFGETSVDQWALNNQQHATSQQRLPGSGLDSTSGIDSRSTLASALTQATAQRQTPGDDSSVSQQVNSEFRDETTRAQALVTQSLSGQPASTIQPTTEGSEKQGEHLKPGVQQSGIIGPTRISDPIEPVRAAQISNVSITEGAATIKTSDVDPKQSLSPAMAIPGKGVVPATKLNVAETAVVMQPQEGLQQEIKSVAQLIKQNVSGEGERYGQSGLDGMRSPQGSQTNTNVNRYDTMQASAVTYARAVEDQTLRELSSSGHKMAELLPNAADGKTTVDSADRAAAMLQRGLTMPVDSTRANPAPQGLGESSSRELSAAVHDQVLRSMTRQALAQGRLNIQLNPRELGALDIEFSQERGELQVSIVAREPVTRDLLDGSLQRLRQSLQDAGISVGDLDVRQESNEDQQQAENDKLPGHAESNSEQDRVADTDEVLVSRTDNVFDVYV